VAKADRDMEWRLVATKGRESCRWQAVDSSWVALSLGAQGDITKVVVTASDGRSEVVDGYEQGLNLARRWRNDWVPADTSTAPSHSSGPWLPPLPGRPGEASDDANAPVNANEPPSTTRGSVPPAASSRHRSSPPAAGSFPPGSPSPTSPLSSSAGSRISQSRPVSRTSQFPIPSLTSTPEERPAGASGDRWSTVPRPAAGGSSRSLTKPAPEPTESDHDVVGRPTGPRNK
jgi:hypothetical protein